MLEKRSCFWKANVRRDESRDVFTTDLAWAPTQVLFLLLSSPAWHKTSCTQSCCAFGPSCLAYWSEKDPRFCWNISWKTGLGKNCCPRQPSEIKKTPKPNKLVPRRPKCCNVERASKPKTRKSQTGQSRYFTSMFLRSFSEIPIFYFFLFPEGMWQFQNINFEMSLSFKQTNLLKPSLSCQYFPLQTIGRSWWNNI